MPSDNSNLYENICNKLNSIISFKNNIKGYMETYITDGNPTGIHDLSEISEDKPDNELLNKGYLPDYNILLKDYLNAKYIPDPSLLSKAKLNTDNLEVISRSLEYLINFKGDSSAYINGIEPNLLKGSKLLSDYDFAINDLLLGDSTEFGDELKHQLMMVGGPGFINSEDITIEGFSSFSEYKNYIFNYSDPNNDGLYRKIENIKNLDLLNGQGLLNIINGTIGLKPVKKENEKKYRYIFVDYINHEAEKIIEETNNNIIKQKYSITSRTPNNYTTSYTYNFEDTGLYYGNNILELRNGKYVWKSESFKWKAIPVKYYNETIFDENNQLINYEQDRCAISYGSNKSNTNFDVKLGETDMKFRNDLLSFINTHPELASEHTQYKLIKIAETHEFRKVSMLSQSFTHSDASTTKTIDNVSFSFPTQLHYSTGSNFYVDVSTKYKTTSKSWVTAINGTVCNFHYGDVSILNVTALTGYTLSLSNPSLNPNNINTTSIDISVNLNPSNANDLISEYEWDVSILTPQYISLKKKESKKFTINILSSSEEHTASLFVYNTHNPSIKSSPFNLNVQSDLWSGNNGLIHLKFRIILDGFFGNSTDGKYGSFDWGRDGGSSAQWKEIKLFFGNGTASSVSNRPIYRCKMQEPNGEQRIFELSFKQLYEMWHKTAYTGSTALNLYFNTGNSTTPSRIIIAPSQTTGNINLGNEPKLGIGYITYPNITNNSEIEYNNFENRYTPSKIIVPFKPHDSYKTSLFIIDPSVFEKSSLQPYNYVIGSNGSSVSDPTGFHIPVPSTATATNNVIFIPTGSDLNLNEIQIRTERYSSTSSNPVKQEYRLSYILYKVRKHGGPWNGHKIIPTNKFNSESDYNYTFTGIKNDYSPEICIDLVFNHQYNTGGYEGA